MPTPVYQKLSPEQLRSVRDFFRDKPDADHCYLFHDGAVEGQVEVYGSRTGQLVSMSTRGIPMLVYRRGVE